MIHQVCTFTAAGMLFGLDVHDVHEVNRSIEMTPVPLAPDVVAGLVNLRGQIVAAVDLRRTLGLPLRPAEVVPMHVVVRTDEGATSLLVDDIGDVVELEEDTRSAPLATLDGRVRPFVLGVHKVGSTLMLLLDAQRLTDVDAARDRVAALTEGD